MGKVTKKQMPLWAKTGHQKPVTRREFLAAGLIPFAASAMLPSALTMFSSEAFAEAMSCPTGGSGLPAMVTINCSGGGGLSANYLPRLANGAMLSSYNRMGFPNPVNDGMVQSQFGVASFAPNSGFINGLNASGVSADALAKSAFVAMCVQSRDDSGENKFDISGIAYRAGLTGLTLPNMGTGGTSTGINQKPSTISPPLPLRVSSFQSFNNAVSYTAALRNNLGANTAQGNELRASLTRLVSNLTASQTRKLASMPQTAQLKTLVDCAANKNVELISNSAATAASIDPLADSAIGGQVATLYGINSGTNNDQRIFSAMIYNALKGLAGTANIELGGFDYHDGTRTTGDNKDAELGRTVGRALQMAHLMNKKLFIYVTSDGAVGSETNSVNWVADRGDAGMAYMIMYDPAGRRPTLSSQVNAFTQGQIADESHAIGAEAERAGQAAFANYCKFAVGDGWLGLYHKAISGTGLDDDQLRECVKVG